MPERHSYCYSKFASDGSAATLPFLIIHLKFGFISLVNNPK